jgi:DNA-directed RNA polymerase subunit RPC12/RpoP
MGCILGLYKANPPVASPSYKILVHRVIHRMMVKAPCVLCAGPLEFDSDIAGEIIECPHCGKLTMLTRPKPPNPVPLPGLPNSPIESSLEKIAHVFGWTSFIGVVIAVGALITSSNESGSSQENYLYIAASGVSIAASGIIFYYLFLAAAETIRLLRKIAK